MPFPLRMNSDLIPIATELIDALEVLDNAREETLKQARAVVRSASRAIAALHRGENADMAGVRRQARAVLDAVKRHRHPVLYSVASDALHEWVEAEMLYAVYRHATLPTPSELGVLPELYASALGDLVGELRRMAVQAMADGELSQAREGLALMEDIYELLCMADFPTKLGNIKHKRDVARALIDRTRGELLLSSSVRAIVP